MKNNKIFKRITLGSLMLAGLVGACKEEFLELPPQGVYTQASLGTKQGIEGLLINAYATLDGRPGAQLTGSTNWVMGSVASDDANKGTEPADFSSINDVELYLQLPSNGPVNDKFRGAIDGIGQANIVLRELKTNTELTDADKKRIEGEARFIRGHWHFEGRKVFGLGFPFIPENLVSADDFKTLTNGTEIWPQIEADLKFGYDNLPARQPQIGRANKWAAGAFLAKAMIFQKKYAAALAILNDVMANGTTSGGVKYALNENYGANFRIATKNSKETIFAVQYAINDGANGNTNGNVENNLNFPHGSGDKPGGCCGFFQPSQALVNSYMTDAVTGLPTMNPYTTDGVSSDYLVSSNQPFTPYAGTVDPRLDHTVGRRGIQYLDWGPHPGRDWIRDVTNGGPYSPKKNVHARAELANGSAGTGGWGQAANSLSFPIMRYADVILLAAEAEADAGNLLRATTLVNQVRTRAGSTETIEGLRKVGSNTAGPIGNYKVGNYILFTSKDQAMAAILEERKLELAMEGHRKFDLVRVGKAAATLNAYKDFEKRFLPKFNNANFTAGQDEYMPVPENAIITSRTASGTFNLKQVYSY